MKWVSLMTGEDLKKQAYASNVLKSTNLFETCLSPHFLVYYDLYAYIIYFFQIFLIVTNAFIENIHFLDFPI